MFCLLVVCISMLLAVPVQSANTAPVSASSLPALPSAHKNASATSAPSSSAAMPMDIARTVDSSSEVKTRASTQAVPMHIAAPRQEVRRFADRFLPIFLDDAEPKPKKGNYYAMNRQVFAALISIIPFIVSTHAFLNAIEFGRVNGGQLDLNEWVIRYVGQASDLLLLMYEPASIFGAAKKSEQRDALSDRELKLGIKVDHMTIVSLAQLEKDQKEGKERESVRTFMQALWDNRTRSSNIFVTRAEYAKNGVNPDDIPAWAFYLSGHGSRLPHPIIAGLEVGQFQEMLSFLATKIKTSFFAYMTCYGVGQNIKKAFEESNPIVGRTYPFMIVTAGVPDDIFIHYPSTNLGTEWSKIQKLLIQDNLHFEQVFVEIFGNLVRSQLIYVRYPGVSWFVPANMARSPFSIGARMVLTRNEPLVTDRLPTGGWQGTPIILVSSLIIPFPLIIGKKVPHFVEQHGSPCTYFERVRLTDLHLTSFVTLLAMNNRLDEADHFFWFKKIIFEKPRFAQMTVPEADDLVVIIRPRTGALEVFLTIGPKSYRLSNDMQSLIEVPDYRKDVGLKDLKLHLDEEEKYMMRVRKNAQAFSGTLEAAYRKRQDKERKAEEAARRTRLENRITVRAKRSATSAAASAAASATASATESAMTE